MALVSLEGCWLHLNQQFCDTFGYTREELAAHTWQDLACSGDASDSGEAAGVADLTLFERVRAGDLDAYGIDRRYLRKDGAPVWVHLIASLERTPADVPDHILTTVEDITERKRLEQDHARLLVLERGARAETEAMNSRLRALLALTDTALSHLLLDDLLRELLGRVTDVMGVDHVAIFMLDED